MPLLLLLVVLFAIALVTGACGGGGGANATRPLPEAPGRMDITSTAFTDGAAIPKRFTCDGDGDSPQLAWSGVPTDAKELVLTVDDPKAGHYVHWTVLGIPPTVMGTSEDEDPDGGEDAENSAGDDGWTPPCPPEGDGTHEYEFAIYAVDAPLGLPDDASHDDLRAALEDHALARGVLKGTFGR
jgi:Raf kinase inhibitor-like YbhB/YbcL family protein